RRDYKCLLKGRGYDDYTEINTLYDNCPEDDVDNKSHDKAKVKPIHTTGTKSHARVREEMSPTRTQVYIECHQHESEADITVCVFFPLLSIDFFISITCFTLANYLIVHALKNQIKNVAAEQGDKEVELDDDPVSKVLGKDQYGGVCGLGLGVKPSNVGDPTYP
ncbi:Uncharacterized protein RDABS01_031284, partial [Bienertia sinuspersici]